jgi:hypothetical protein
MRGNKADIEEIAPDRFIVRDMRARPILKGEGELNGPLFELRTWRREGLFARLRAIGLHVVSFEDQIDALPGLPPAPPIGLTGWRLIATATERFSRFDRDTLSWLPITPVPRNQQLGIEVPFGHPLRRRKSRGAADFYVAIAERSGAVGLQAVDETRALLIGYAIVAERRPVEIMAERHDAETWLPTITLPPAHHTLMERIATETDGYWHSQGRGSEFAIGVYGRLGVEVGG